MSEMGRLRPEGVESGHLGGPVSQLFFEFQNERLNGLSGTVRHFSASVAEKTCPVTKCIRMNRVTAQATGILHGRRQIVHNAAMQFHADVLVQNFARSTHAIRSRWADWGGKRT